MFPEDRRTVAELIDTMMGVGRAQTGSLGRAALEWSTQANRPQALNGRPIEYNADGTAPGLVNYRDPERVIVHPGDVDPGPLLPQAMPKTWRGLLPGYVTEHPARLTLFVLAPAQVMRRLEQFTTPGTPKITFMFDLWVESHRLIQQRVDGIEALLGELPLGGVSPLDEPAPADPQRSLIWAGGAKHALQISREGLKAYL